jgi:hypothetical protein
MLSAKLECDGGTPLLPQQGSADREEEQRQGEPERLDR